MKGIIWKEVPVFRNIVFKYSKYSDCRNYLEIPCPKCNSNMVHSEILKSIKDYQIKKEKQRLPMHEIDEKKIRKVKINKGYSQAICLNKECGYTLLLLL